MAWLNASLLWGAALAAAPILLHLAMKPRPKRFIFPAVRFVQRRKETNQRSLRLRHWMLLALRSLAVLLLALLFARPSTHESTAAAWGLIGLLLLGALLLAAVALAAWLTQRGRMWVIASAVASAAMAIVALVLGLRASNDASTVLLGNREAPLSAILVVDTSVRMDYVHSNESSLQRAQDTAKWVLEQLPQASEAAVLDSRAQPAAFSADLAAAEQALDRLETAAAGRSLSEVIAQALLLTEASQYERKELYVFTDLSQTAWGGEDARQDESALANQLQQHSEVSLYIIDVGAPQPINRLLRPLRLSAENLPQGGLLTIQSSVEVMGGTGGEATVELWIDDNDPTRPLLEDGKVLRPAMQKRAEQIVSLTPGQSAAFQFQVKSLPLGSAPRIRSTHRIRWLAHRQSAPFRRRSRQGVPGAVGAPSGRGRHVCQRNVGAQRVSCFRPSGIRMRRDGPSRLGKPQPRRFRRGVPDRPATVDRTPMARSGRIRRTRRRPGRAARPQRAADRLLQRA